MFSMLAYLILSLTVYNNYNIEETIIRLVQFVIGVTIIYIAFCIAMAIRKRLILAGASIRQIDKMSGHDFELYLKKLFLNNGYEEVKLTPSSHDYGADLIVVKNGTKIAVQAKRYRTHVGVEAVQQVLAAQSYYDTDYCMVVTNSYYTGEAVKMAKKCKVILKNRNHLEKGQL